MTSLIDSEYIIETIRDFMIDYKDDEKATDVIIAMGSEILEVSADRLLEMI